MCPIFRSEPLSSGEKRGAFRLSPFSSRRRFLKWAGAVPVFAHLGARNLWSAVGRRGKANIYTRIGVRPLINARGVWTYLSGTLELPEVRAAKQEAALHFVDIFELQRAVGRRLAELTGAESGMITAGAAAAMSAATAGCMAGADPAKIWQLPDTTGMKSEVVVFPSRNAFDSAIRLAGARLVVARTHEELQSAINANTAMVYTTAVGERLEKALAISKRAKAPLLLDQAAGIPPITNISLYAKMGCDLYTFSGGKGLHGPQCSGLLLGRKDLIEAALANTSPWEGAVCRPMKVGKEEIMGCLAAVEAWLKMDLEGLVRKWTASLKRIARLVETVPGVTTELIMPEAPHRVNPRLVVRWDQNVVRLTVAECDRQLREGDPRIEVLTSNNPSLVPAVAEGRAQIPQQIDITAITLQPGEDLIIARRLRQILVG